MEHLRLRKSLFFLIGIVFLNTEIITFAVVYLHRFTGWQCFVVNTHTGRDMIMTVKHGLTFINHIIKILKCEFVGGVDRHSTWKLSFLRWGGRGGEGGRSTLNLESEVGITLRIWGGSTLILGGGSINTQLGKWSWDYLADLGWIDTDPGGVDRHSTWKGSARTLEGLPQLGKDPQDLGRIASMWKGSAKTLEGSPQLGKDLQRPWKDRLNMERIHNDFGRITSTWKGSAMTLEGLPELGKDTQWLWKDRLCQCWSWGDLGDFESEVGITLRIRGRLTLTLKVKLGLPCGSGVDRHWSWGGGGQSTLTLKVKLGLPCGSGGGSTLILGGVDWHSLWKWSWDYLADPGWIWGGSTLILGRGRGGEGGGRLTLNLKVKLGLPCRSRVDWHWSWGGLINTHFESEVGITLQIRGGSTLILGGSIDTHFESEVGITLQIRGGSTLILGGGRSTLTLKVKLGLPCRSGVDRHWSWGGGQLTLTLKVKLGLPCRSGVDWHWILGGVDRHSLWKWSWDYLADLGWIDTDPGGGQSTLTLKVKLGLPCRSGVDWHWSWGGGRSTLTLKVKLGLPCRSRVDQHWSWGGGWSTLTLKVKLGLPCRSGVDWHWSWGEGGQSTLTLKVKLGLPCRSGVDQHWSWEVGWSTLNFESEVGITLQIRGGRGHWSWRGVNRHSTLKVKLGLPCRSGVDWHWSWGGWSTLTLKVKLGLPCRSGVDWHWSWGGRSTLTLKVKLGLPCRSGVDWHWILGGVDWHSLWKWSWDYLADPGWIDTDPGGGSIDTQLGKDPQWLWKDHLCHCWSWGRASVHPRHSMHSMGWPLVFITKK